MSREVDFVWLEGYLEEPVARKLLAGADLHGENTLYKVAGGTGSFWKRVIDRNESAKAGLVVVALGDLEQESCPGQVIRQHLPTGTCERFALRLAVRMLESWLLADVAAVSRYFGAPLAKIPSDPDSLTHPKLELVNLVRRYGSTAVKRDVVPETGLSGIVGKGYRPRMEEFVTDHWDPARAARNSASLRRANAALARLASARA